MKIFPSYHPAFFSGPLDSARAKAGNLDELFFCYQKAGIMLGDFFSQGVAQLNLFDENAPRAGSERLMEVLDQLNAKDGKETLYFAGQGIQQQWQMKREMLSPRYTTRYSDLLRVR